MRTLGSPAREMGIITLENTDRWTLKKLPDDSYELTNKTFEGSSENWTISFTGLDAVRLKQTLSRQGNMSLNTFLGSIWRANYTRARKNT